MKTTPLGMLEHQAAWRPDGELGKWAIGNPAVVKLGDTLFVHGGISAAYAAFADRARSTGRSPPRSRRRTQSPTAIINDPHGPLWYRGLIIRGDGDEATVAPIAAGRDRAADHRPGDRPGAASNYGVKRIVVGHTPSREGIIAGGRRQAVAGR